MYIVETCIFFFLFSLTLVVININYQKTKLSCFTLLDLSWSLPDSFCFIRIVTFFLMKCGSIHEFISRKINRTRRFQCCHRGSLRAVKWPGTLPARCFMMLTCRPLAVIRWASLDNIDTPSSCLEKRSMTFMNVFIPCDFFRGVTGRALDWPFSGRTSRDFDRAVVAYWSPLALK